MPGIILICISDSIILGSRPGNHSLNKYIIMLYSNTRCGHDIADCFTKAMMLKAVSTIVYKATRL